MKGLLHCSCKEPWELTTVLGNVPSNGANNIGAKTNMSSQFLSWTLAFLSAQCLLSRFYNSSFKNDKLVFLSEQNVKYMRFVNSRSLEFVCLIDVLDRLFACSIM